MRTNVLITTVFFLVLFFQQTACGEVQLFTGNLEVVTTSGKACAGRKGNHPVSLVIGSDDDASEEHEAVFGYIGGETVTVGQLRGQSPGSLMVRYPFPDSDRAEGHVVSVEISGNVLSGELRDRHLPVDADDCNFDLARLRLVLADSDKEAHKVYQRLALQYEAQLTRATALSISRSGAHDESVHVFEKALAIADQLYPPDSPKLLPYLTSLVNSYMRTGRYIDFGRLYNARVGVLSDEVVRSIFTRHQLSSLIQVGRAAMGRGDYDSALDNFRQALKVDYKNKDAIAATMSALVRSGRHDEAIEFLEETERKLESDPDKKDVREAIALVTYQKARKDQKEGHTVEAERSLRKAIKLDPGTAYYLVVLARWVHKAGRYSEADTILKKGLDTFKDDAKRQELIEARNKLRQTEMILARIRRSGA